MQHEKHVDQSNSRAPVPDMGDMQQATYALSGIFEAILAIDDGHLDDVFTKFDRETMRNGLSIAGRLLCDDFKRRF